MHCADAAPAEADLEAKIEVGRVYADDDIGTPLQEPPSQLAPQRQQLRQMNDHLRETHDRQPVAGPPCLQTRPGHLRPPYPGKNGVRSSIRDGSYQSRTQLIPRGFAGDQTDT
jgi:hypothetical protein